MRNIIEFIVHFVGGLLVSLLVIGAITYGSIDGLAFGIPLALLATYIIQCILSIPAKLFRESTLSPKGHSILRISAVITGFFIAGIVYIISTAIAWR